VVSPRVAFEGRGGSGWATGARDHGEPSSPLRAQGPANESPTPR